MINLAMRIRAWEDGHHTAYFSPFPTFIPEDSLDLNEKNPKELRLSILQELHCFYSPQVTLKLLVPLAYLQCYYTP